MSPPIQAGPRRPAGGRFDLRLAALLLVLWIAVTATAYVVGWPPIVGRVAAGAVGLVWLGHGLWISRLPARPERDPTTGRFGR